jgi:hypothetical protein
MDPNETYRIMNDTSIPREERTAAAVNLRDWMIRGGFPPDGVDRAAAFRQCSLMRHPSFGGFQ